MKIELLPEPTLEFGNNFLSDDPKKGIQIGGFYSISHSSHHSEIRYSVIGTLRNIDLLNEWISSLQNPIEATVTQIVESLETKIVDGEVVDFESDSTPPNSMELFQDDQFDQDQLQDHEKSYINKKLNPDYPGFSKNSCFHSCFIHDDLNESRIREDDLERIIKNKEFSKIDKLEAIIQIFCNSFKSLIDNFSTKPDICIVIIPSIIYKQFSSISYGKVKINFRRKLKARLITLSKDLPVQIILEDTLKETKDSLQDKSMIAWNFSVAQYYKTDSIPWSLTDIDRNTCFIGISFHKLIDPEKSLMRSSIAQAFNREGRGLVFMGKPFEWDCDSTKVAAPHLTYEYSNSLVKDIINTFVIQNKGVKPTRVVVHKTTDFWNSAINKDYCEVEGIKDGIKEVLGDNVDIDLVAIKDSDIKLFREKGMYPVIRGTYMEINEHDAILYTTGYIPYYETFPGVHMPLAKSISLYEGETSIKNVCREILSLTKMNFNNCNYYDSLPITLRFAQKVGEIIQYFPDDEKFLPPNRYYFYM